MRISDWSSDVCSSDLAWAAYPERNLEIVIPTAEGGGADRDIRIFTSVWKNHLDANFEYSFFPGAAGQVGYEVFGGKREPDCYSRSEEHTSELQSLMRISYAVFCLKKKQHTSWIWYLIHNQIH